MTVEVFKTNVVHRDHAAMLIEEIERCFSGCKATFDLEDCDRVLRVQSHKNMVPPTFLIDFLLGFGFEVSVLPDVVLGNPEGK